MLVDASRRFEDHETSAVLSGAIGVRAVVGLRCCGLQKNFTTTY
jgi:hypothetical protein